MKKIVIFFNVIFSVQQAFCAAVAAGGLHSMPQDSVFGIFATALGGGTEQLENRDEIDELALREDLSDEEYEKALLVRWHLQEAIRLADELIKYLELHGNQPYSEKDFSQNDVRELLSQAADESAT